MESKSMKKGSEEAHSRRAASHEEDLRLDDLEEEIIDLVDVVEEGASLSGVAPAEEFEVANNLVGGDIELEGEVSEKAEARMAGVSEDEMREADELLGEVEDEFESLLRAEPAEPAEPEADLENLSPAGDDLGEEETDKELADLFASDELEVSKLLEDGSAGTEAGSAPLKREESAPDEKFLEGLFDDLELEKEGADGVDASSDEVPTEDQGSTELLAELGLEPDVTPRAAAPQALVPVEELPEDLFADLEKSGRGAPEMPEAAAVPPPVASWNAEELAALVREQVEGLVTSLVEARLPAIAESILMEEIRKIKAAME
jgi:hypothetical protein